MSEEKTFNWRQYLESRVILAFVLGGVAMYMYQKWSRKARASSMVRVLPAQTIPAVAVQSVPQPVAQSAQAGTVSGMGNINAAGFEDLGYLGVGESGPPGSSAAVSAPATPGSDFEVLSEGVF